MGQGLSMTAPASEIVVTSKSPSWKRKKVDSAGPSCFAGSAERRNGDTGSAGGFFRAGAEQVACGEGGAGGEDLAAGDSGAGLEHGASSGI